MSYLLSKKKEENILTAKEEKFLCWDEILSVPTRFVRDWIVSRYADKILDVIKLFKKSIQRIEFLIEENNEKNDQINFSKKNKITPIENSLLNYNRFNSNNRFDNFVVGESNELAYTAARKICVESAHYNPLFIYSSVGMGKTHLLNSIGLEVGESKKVIRDFLNKISKITLLKKENIEPIIKELIEENKINFKGVGQPLRIALTGSRFGNGIYDIIISLGKEEVVKRLRNKAFG